MNSHELIHEMALLLRSIALPADSEEARKRLALVPRAADRAAVWAHECIYALAHIAIDDATPAGVLAAYLEHASKDPTHWHGFETLSYVGADFDSWREEHRAPPALSAPWGAAVCPSIPVARWDDERGGYVTDDDDDDLTTDTSNTDKENR